MKSYLEIISDFQKDLIQHKNIGENGIVEMRISPKMFWGIIQEIETHHPDKNKYRKTPFSGTIIEFDLNTETGPLTIKRDTKAEKQELRRQIEKLEEKIKELG
jgi:hypothetical protein